MSMFVLAVLVTPVTSEAGNLCVVGCVGQAAPVTSEAGNLCVVGCVGQAIPVTSEAGNLCLVGCDVRGR